MELAITKHGSKRKTSVGDGVVFVGKKRLEMWRDAFILSRCIVGITGIVHAFSRLSITQTLRAVNQFRVPLAWAWQCVPPHPVIPHYSFNWTNTFHISPMAMPGPSTFQSTISHALRVYKERVKIDLLLHPLAVQLQLCDSSHAVISVLQEQAGAIDQSLKKVLHPTVNAIYAFSSSLQGFGMVYICACSFGTCPVHSFSRYYPQRKSYLLASVSS
jgi:hypothetical protein